MVHDIYTFFKDLQFKEAYFVILILSAIIYKVAFARSLPLLKGILVYIILAFGCILSAFFHILRFPIIPVLFFTVILIAITRIRLYMTRKKEEGVSDGT